MTRITTLYATHGYTNSPTKPSWVLIYRDRSASHCVAMMAADSPNAPKPTDRTINLARVNRRGVIETTSYALEWLD